MAPIPPPADATTWLGTTVLTALIVLFFFFGIRHVRHRQSLRRWLVPAYLEGDGAQQQQEDLWLRQADGTSLANPQSLGR